ncbi:MAG: hypothetical protein DRN14_02600 [Thermoplasmata archaeon]|nr:MAG: hypothetical protein DRN14_02600 [Thermoplasmata archaeon]
MDKEMKALLERYKVEYEIIRHKTSGKTTDDAEKSLGVSRENILKSILMENERQEYLGAIITGDKMIDTKKVKVIAKKIGIFTNYKFKFADAETVEKVLGYKIGGVPPFAFYLKGITTLVDAYVMWRDYVIGAGGDEYTGLKFKPSIFARIYTVTNISK